MSAEPLRTVLHAAADGAAPPPSVDGLHDHLVHRRRRRTRSRAVAAAVAGVVAVAGMAALVTRPGPATTPPVAEAPSGWSALPPSPLSPRHSSRAVSVGEEVLVLGGSSEPICPANADCRGPADEELLRDGAAYDVRTDRWRPLVPAPLPPSRAAVAVLGDVVHLLTDERHVGYDVSEDRWEDLPLPPGEDGHRLGGLVAAGDVLVAYQSVTDRPDAVYDPQDRTWTALPVDPLAPAFDRQYVWTGDALVLLAARLVPQPGSDGPSLQRAAALDLGRRTWRAFADSTETVTGFASWSWDGRRVLSTGFQTVDGGGSYGRTYTSAGALDPATGTWSTFEPPPAPDVSRGGDRGIGASSARYKAVGHALLDTTTDRWLVVPPAPEEVAPGSAQAWAGDVLVAWGGGRPFDDPDRGELVATGARYRP